MLSPHPRGRDRHNHTNAHLSLCGQPPRLHLWIDREFRQGSKRPRAGAGMFFGQKNTKVLKKR